MRKTKNKLQLTLLGLFLIFTPIFAKAQINTNITADSAWTLTQFYAQNPNFVILDMRTASEYYAGHIEKATNLDFFSSDFGSTLDSMDKNKIYLIHCASGGRSGKAKDSMANRNFMNVYNMMGGYNKWVKTYPITLLTAPLLSIYGQDSIDLGYIPVGIPKTITIKLTNGANDTLKFFSIVGSINPNFTTNFSLSPQLLGYNDYNFQITYNPLNQGIDTSSITILSNGGVHKIKLRAIGSALGIQGNVHQKQATIYPNPAQDFITIRTKDRDLKEFILMDSRGSILKTITIKTKNSRLNISDLKPGMYFLSNAEYSLRFIKN